jgi:hypothetical protein
VLPAAKKTQHWKPYRDDVLAFNHEIGWKLT